MALGEEVQVVVQVGPLNLVGEGLGLAHLP